MSHVSRSIPTTSYAEQVRRWPTLGRHILAQFDDDSIIVYQAYRGEIGNFAVKHGYFGGAFSYSRMSWIKPNFLWMVYRSDWGRSQGQEVVLAIRRAIQIGLRGKALEAYGKNEPVEIIDMSGFVAQQREFIGDWRSGTLLTPSEQVYTPSSPSAAANIELDECRGNSAENEK